MRLRLSLFILILLSFSSSVFADSVSPALPALPPSQTASTASASGEPSSLHLATAPFSWLGRGLTLSYERRPLPHRYPRLSATAMLGFRAGAGGDFTSRTGTLGATVTWWPLSSAARPMRRLAVSLHTSASLTSVTDEVMDERIGSSWTLTQRLDVGYRFVLFRRLTLTPSLGLGAREDLDRTGRLAATARPIFGLGFELGWLL